MSDELEILRGFNMTTETDKLNRNVIIYSIVNISILFITALASVINLIGNGTDNGSAVLNGNTIFMATLEIIVILIILKLFRSFINDDKGSQIIFFKAKKIIVDGKYDEEIKSSYRPTKVYKSFNTLLIIHICIVIVDVIISIAISDFRNWVIVTTSVLNMVGSLLELFLLINISKFLTLRELESKKCLEIMSKVNNMKDDYKINENYLNDGVCSMLLNFSFVLCILFAILYVAAGIILIISTALDIMKFTPMSIISLVVGGAVDIYLLYFLRGYFKYQRDFTIAIKAAISLLNKERRSYFEGYNSIFK